MNYGIDYLNKHWKDKSVRFRADLLNGSAAELHEDLEKEAWGTNREDIRVKLVFAATVAAAQLCDDMHAYGHSDVETANTLLAPLSVLAAHTDAVVDGMAWGVKEVTSAYTETRRFETDWIQWYSELLVLKEVASFVLRCPGLHKYRVHLLTGMCELFDKGIDILFEELAKRGHNTQDNGMGGGISGTKA